MITLLVFWNFIKRNQQFNSSDNSSTEFDPNKSESIKLILAFAVGSLVADVFLHILPEATQAFSQAGYQTANIQHFLGVWILIGILMFACLETFFHLLTNVEKKSDSERIVTANQPIVPINSSIKLRNRKIATKGKLVLE